MTSPLVQREEFAARETRELTETSTAAVAAKARASVEARYVMAMQRPRDWDEVRAKLLKECKRPAFADAAVYDKPVGDDGVRGPSIRFAEAAMRCMTNVMPEVSTVYDDRQKRIVSVAVTDLEANLTYSKDVTIEKTVERRKLQKGQIPISSRYNSKGQEVFLVWATDDEILNKENALISKAIRTSGLRLLPGDIMEECRVQIAATKAQKITEDPDAYRKKLLDGFLEQGISPADLKAYVRQDLDTLSPVQLDRLRDLYNAIRDGETDWREVMDSIDGEDGSGDEKAQERSAKLREKLDASRQRRNERSGQQGPPPDPDPQQQQQPASTPKGNGNGPKGAPKDAGPPLVLDALKKRSAKFNRPEQTEAEIRRLLEAELQQSVERMQGQTIAKAMSFVMACTPDEKVTGGMKEKTNA